MALRVVKYADPVLFRDAVLPKLIEAEAENCRIISLAMSLAEKGIADALNPPRLWTVGGDHGVELVTLQKPGDLLEVSRGSNEAVEVLVEALCSDGPVRAIAGVLPTIEAISACYAERSGLRRKLHRGYRAHCLTSVVQPTRITGSMRCCDESDRQTLSEFMDAYMQAINEPAFPDTGKVAGELIAANRIFFWCDPNPVVMVAWAGPTPNGIRINFVFTPAQFRNRGYASNLVAALTQRLLDEGRRLCFLFTDRGNAQAERIYAQVGYEPVSDGEHWLFEQR